MHIYLKVLQLEGGSPSAYVNLGNALEPGRTLTLPTGEDADQRKLYLKAIELDDGDSNTYYKLGWLSPDEKVTLPDGEEADQRQLFLKAIQLDGKRLKPAS